jgi:transposase
MDAIIKRCAGLDVHKKSIVVCVSIIDEHGKVQRQVRTFATMTRQLEALRDWLLSEQVTHAAMESTGVFWKPVFNILEEHLTILLCNARHIKMVPGRKTDVKDCEWIAQLLQHGLLNGSFIPPRAQRELRDLTRQRAQLSGEKSREINRIHKVLEDANIKLAAVATDILGVSGRAMLRELIAGGTDEAQVAELARRRMRGKIPELKEALHGHMTEHHRYLLGLHLRHIEELEALLAELDGRIAQLQASGALDPADAAPAPPDPPARASTPEPPHQAPPSGGSAGPSARVGPPSFSEAMALLDELPGIDVQGAVDILAEIGCDMRQFPSEKHLASWAKVCSGNEESAGKRKSGATGKGNRWLRSTLCQVAWAASHTKDTYLAAQYHRLVGRRGKKRTLVAVGHSILTGVYHMLAQQVPWRELGGDWFDRLRPERLTRHLVKRLEALGYEVALRPDA